MAQEHLTDTQGPEEAGMGDEASGGEMEATRGLDLSGLLGGLFGGGDSEDAGATRAALLDLAQGKAGASNALAGTGLLQEIMHLTGTDAKGALGVILAVLKALGLGKVPAATSKPKPKPASHTTAKPKPSASTTSKPKPKPKPSATAKPKPKPASHTTTSKPKPKPRPKRSGEIDLGDAGTGEPGA